MAKGLSPSLHGPPPTAPPYGTPPTAPPYGTPPTAPPYGPPPTAPPSYAQAVRAVPSSSSYVPNHGFTGGRQIVTTVVPVKIHTMHMICPHCCAEIDTSTETKPGIIAYIAGTILCLLRCHLGCCLIPCCIGECMDVRHICPNCKAHLARRRR